MPTNSFPFIWQSRSRPPSIAVHGIPSCRLGSLFPLTPSGCRASLLPLLPCMHPHRSHCPMPPWPFPPRRLKSCTTRLRRCHDLKEQADRTSGGAGRVGGTAGDEDVVNSGHGTVPGAGSWDGGGATPRALPTSPLLHLYVFRNLYILTC
jgi:hypothetical protein